MPSVWSSAGAVTRSAAELGTVKVEQQRMLRNNNNVTTVRMNETDTRADEVDEDNLKFADKGAKAVSAKFADDAATLAIISSVLSLASSIGKASTDSNSSKGQKIGNVITASVSGVFDIMNKVLDKLSTGDELDAVGADLNRLGKQKDASGKALAALDANPIG